MKKVTLILALMLTGGMAIAQDAPTSTPLEISGSGDLYYKYDFSGNENIGTSFASDQNSLSLGMIDIALKKKTGKASFVGEVSFGPRGQFQSIPNGDGNLSNLDNSFHIQNLYATYAATDKLSFTAGYMGTFIGYEVISPLANFHYSTSYLFTNGPFQNAGVKATYAFTSKVSLMAGLFNDQWNFYKASPSLGLNAFGAQLTVTPVEGWTAYINILTGSASGTILDFTTSYQITPKFKLGLNVADFSGTIDETGFTGFALYPSYAISDKFSLGVRAENFSVKKLGSPFITPTTDGFSKIAADESVTAFTLSANLKLGGLTFIPEFRLDSASADSFKKSGSTVVDSVEKSGSTVVDSNKKIGSTVVNSKSASQVTLAVVYGF